MYDSRDNSFFPTRRSPTINFPSFVNRQISDNQCLHERQMLVLDIYNHLQSRVNLCLCPGKTYPYTAHTISLQELL